MVIKSQPPTKQYGQAIENDLQMRKKRKLRKEVSENERLSVLHHNLVQNWLEQAIADVRDAWLSKRPSSWYKTHRLKPEANEKPSEASAVDLVAWAEATRVLLEALGDDEITKGVVTMLEGAQNLHVW